MCFWYCVEIPICSMSIKCLNVHAPLSQTSKDQFLTHLSVGANDAALTLRRSGALLAACTILIHLGNSLAWHCHQQVFVNQPTIYPMFRREYHLFEVILALRDEVRESVEDKFKAGWDFGRSSVGYKPFESDLAVGLRMAGEEI